MEQEKINEILDQLFNKMQQMEDALVNDRKTQQILEQVHKEYKTVVNQLKK